MIPVKRVVFGLGILAIFLLAACAQRPVVCPDGSLVRTVAECPQQEMPPAPEPPVTQPNATQQAGETVKEAIMDPTIAKLIEKGKTVKSMSFDYVPIEMKGTGPVLMTLSNTYYVLGDKVKVDVAWNKQNPKTYIDTVYLDLATQTAYGYCLDRDRGTCSSIEARSTSFADWNIPYPQDLLTMIPSDATVKGSRTYLKRETTAIRWKQDDKYYEMLIDQYSGLPIRLSIYSDDFYTALVGGQEYRELQFNNVKPSDVTPPTM